MSTWWHRLVKDISWEQVGAHQAKRRHDVFTARPMGSARSDVGSAGSAAVPDKGLRQYRHASSCRTGVLRSPAMTLTTPPRPLDRNTSRSCEPIRQRPRGCILGPASRRPPKARSAARCCGPPTSLGLCVQTAMLTTFPSSGHQRRSAAVASSTRLHRNGRPRAARGTSPLTRYGHAMSTATARLTVDR
jgi:hypothetical protein